MKTTKLQLTEKELNLLLSALHVRFGGSVDNKETLVGRLTDKLYDSKGELNLKETFNK